MRIGGKPMKLLKIEASCGYYRRVDGSYLPLDKMTKEDLLQLVDWTLCEDNTELDDYDENNIKNQAHQIIYKSVHRKLGDLRGRRQEFMDESARLFVEDYKKYRDSVTAAS